MVRFLFQLQLKSLTTITITRIMDPLEEFETITYEEMNMKYQKIKFLGEGTYGNVYEGKDNKSGRSVALKTIKKIPNLQTNPNSEILREIRILRKASKLEDPRILQLLQAFKIINSQHKVVKIVLVTELCDCTLEEVIEKGKESPIIDKLNLCKQIALGYKSFQKIKCVHRDLKPANILVKKIEGKLIPVIADMGHAKQIDPFYMTMQRGTLLYVDPFINERPSYQNQWDIYSLGMIFFELLTGSFLFNLQGLNEKTFIEKMKHTLKNLDSHLRNNTKLPKNCYTLIKRCLFFKQRFNIDQVLIELDKIIDPDFHPSFEEHRQNVGSLKAIVDINVSSQVKKQLRYVSYAYYLASFGRIKARTDSHNKKRQNYFRSLLGSMNKFHAEIVAQGNIQKFHIETQNIIKNRQFNDPLPFKREFELILTLAQINPAQYQLLK